MSKDDAIKAMRNGKKVTHPFFTSDEWISMEGNKIVCEDGCRHNFYEFWSIRTNLGFLAGWEIFDKERNTHLYIPTL